MDLSRINPNAIRGAIARLQSLVDLRRLAPESLASAPIPAPKEAEFAESLIVLLNRAWEVAARSDEPEAPAAGRFVVSEMGIRTATGTVKAWHDNEGWGVLESSEAPGDVWAHFSAISSNEPGFRSLSEGEPVSFDYHEVPDQDGYSYVAVSVRKG